MLLSNLVTLALALAKIALTQHELRSRPFAKLNAHRALHNTPISSVSNGTSTPTQSTAGTQTPRLSFTAASSCSYWLEDIKHQGFSPFNTNPGSYQVFRNVKDFGAIGTTLYFLDMGQAYTYASAGDGITDDTAAINSAISSGNRCNPANCESSTTTPAVVYFPAGTYLVSSSIIDFYETQLIGNPNCLPTIKAAPSFSLAPGSVGVIDGDIYDQTGHLSYGSTNTFYRQVRNFVIDTTSFPANRLIRGIHWPTAQATSLQNVVFQMSASPGTQHEGVFIEEGSGGFMSDLVFNGGHYGANWGNQQFTMRNLTFNNAVTAINQIWDWGWTYKSITINNCGTGLNMSSIDPATGRQSVGSITLIDSSINNTPIGIATARSTSSLPPTAGSLIIENVVFTNVAPTVSMSDGSTFSATGNLAEFVDGNTYIPSGPIAINGRLSGFPRPANLLQSDGKFYERSKPQYSSEPLEMIYSVRSGGAKGDGVTDDTAAIQHVINLAAYLHKIVFFDFGVYKVTHTLFIPPGSRIVGETYPAGAVLIEINIESPLGSPTGLWDVHSRIGGFSGSFLQQNDCPKTPNVATPPTPVNTRCIAAFLGLHITKTAASVYLENVWIWTADHDLDDPSGQNTQITIYTGRGLLIESKNGPVWLVGTAVEHFALYQYQFANTMNIFAGQIQTETAYYQPNPVATIPFPPVTSLNDPVFIPFPINDSGDIAEGWGLRVLNSENILIYGAGLYSFFNNYDNTCAIPTDNLYCQARIFSIEGSSSNINIYNLNTIGAASMVDRDGNFLARAGDNVNVFPDTIALFRSG
ncbi:glucan 1,3-beta-glucosidase [Physcia stellaris]|nr:glucan 1,3-beta-glucosidase [Physcia stellaris]